MNCCNQKTSSSHSKLSLHDSSEAPAMTVLSKDLRGASDVTGSTSTPGGMAAILVGVSAASSDPFLTFFAEARLGGGGEIPRLDAFDRVLIGEAVAGGPRNGDGTRSKCETDV